MSWLISFEILGKHKKERIVRKTSPLGVGFESRPPHQYQVCWDAAADQEPTCSVRY